MVKEKRFKVVKDRKTKVFKVNAHGRCVRDRLLKQTPQHATSCPGNETYSTTCRSASNSEIVDQFDIETHSLPAFLLSGEVKEKTSSTSNSYSSIKERELESWNEVSENLMQNFFTKYEDIMERGKCDLCGCGCEDGFIHCKECGPFVSYCETCVNSAHIGKPFHSPFKIGNDFTTTPVNIPRRLHDPHTLDCPTNFIRLISVINFKGVLQDVTIQFCDCSSQILTLLKLGLWPATPKKPTTAISTDLLNLFVSLQLEGKISLTSFCDGLAWKSGTYNKEVRSALTKFLKSDAIDQYRSFRREFITLEKTCNGSYYGFRKCCACPVDVGSLHICLDANFALVRKMASTSLKPTDRSTQMFVPDRDVDEFMQAYDDTAKDKDCNNFQAGTNLRAKSRENKLSVTGIFGASCRHEFPLKFLNMRHGERLGYSVILLNNMLDRIRETDLRVHVIYDIACVLKRHLEIKGIAEKYTGFKLGIPVFHSYGHKGSCQVKNSIRRLDGFGLMDGELMERLWSYLRSFSKVTKEMTAAHRTDLLCDALYHFGAIKMQNIGSHVCFLKKKAISTLENCKSELETLDSELPVVLNEKILNAWKNEEETDIQDTNKNKAEDWRLTYFTTLQDFKKERHLACHSPSLIDAAKHTKKATRLDMKLKSVEKKRQFARWTKESAPYRTQNEKFLCKKMTDALQQCYNQSSERCYLLNLKKNYANGSSIATRLSKQIDKVCKNIRSLVSSYNTHRFELHGNNHGKVSYYSALDLSSDVYTDTVGIKVKSTPGVPESAKRRAVMLFCRQKRAEEEISLVEQEMANCISYWMDEVETLDKCISLTKGGILVRLHNERAHISAHLNELRQSFANPSQEGENHAFFECDSESDDDDEEEEDLEQE